MPINMTEYVSSYWHKSTEDRRDQDKHPAQSIIYDGAPSYNDRQRLPADDGGFASQKSAYRQQRAADKTDPHRQGEYEAAIAHACA